MRSQSRRLVNSVHQEELCAFPASTHPPASVSAPSTRVAPRTPCVSRTPVRPWRSAPGHRGRPRGDRPPAVRSEGRRRQSARPATPRRNIFCVGRNYPSTRRSSPERLRRHRRQGRPSRAPRCVHQARRIGDRLGEVFDPHTDITRPSTTRARSASSSAGAPQGQRPRRWTTCGATPSSTTSPRVTCSTTRPVVHRQGPGHLLPDGPVGRHRRRDRHHRSAAADPRQRRTAPGRQHLPADLRRGDHHRTLSAGITLEPGDVIATGTPVGVGIGFYPPTYLAEGDELSSPGRGRAN